MIELRVADYCNNCVEFEPDVVKAYNFGNDAYTTIDCLHKKTMLRDDSVSQERT